MRFTFINNNNNIGGSAMVRGSQACADVDESRKGKGGRPSPRLKQGRKVAQSQSEALEGRGRYTAEGEVGRQPDSFTLVTYL